MEKKSYDTGMRVSVIVILFDLRDFQQMLASKNLWIYIVTSILTSVSRNVNFIVRSIAAEWSVMEWMLAKIWTTKNESSACHSDAQRHFSLLFITTWNNSKRQNHNRNERKKKSQIEIDIWLSDWSNVNEEKTWFMKFFTWSQQKGSINVICFVGNVVFSTHKIFNITIFHFAYFPMNKLQNWVIRPMSKF